jgi:GNAT superfamily N-acetyltransferase
MQIQQTSVQPQGIKFFIEDQGQEIARTYLYLLHNDLHKEPFGFMEDVFVDPNYRGQNLGNLIVDAAMQEAKTQGCYKLICTSRHSKTQIHSWYQRKGFTNHGLEFRLDI